MKILIAAIAIALVLPTAASAGFGDGEMFNQLVVMLELDKGDQQKLAVALITLGENLTAAVEGVGDETVDPKDMYDDFNAARETFRDDCRAFMSAEQFETLLRYRSAVFYSLTEGIALSQVKTFQSRLLLTEDQVTKLTLVVSEDLRSIVSTFLEYDDREVGPAEVDAMNKALTDTRSGTRLQILSILDSTQRKKLEQLQEEEAAAKAEQG